MKKKSSNEERKRSPNENESGDGNDDENEATTHASNVSPGRRNNDIDDNNNNGMGVARRASPSSSSSLPPPRPSVSRKLLSEDKFGKLKQSSSSDTMSTATGSITHFSTGTNSLATTRSKLPSKPSPSRSHRSQQRLLNRQLQILASVSGGSVIMFLLFFLNFFAFAALIIGLSSTSMLAYTAYIYFLHILNGGDGTLFDYLPESMQNYLTNTSLHQAMTDDSSFLENRWYLLYLIPGLTPEQINSMVSRLPQRHRDMAHGAGGVARLALPDSVFRLVAPPNARGPTPHQQNNPHNTRNVGSGHVMRITDGEEAIPLPVIQEDDETDDESTGVEVTIQDAFQGILSNARNLVVGDISNDVENDDNAENLQPDLQDLHWGESNDSDLQGPRVEVHIVDDSDSETSDLGIDISPDDFTGGMNDGEISRLGRFLRLTSSPSREESVEVSSPPSRRSSPPRSVQQPPGTVTARIDDIIMQSLTAESMEDDEEQTLEEQQEAEGDILNEAISTAVDNITTSSTTAISDTIASAVVSVVESVTPSLIRTGTRLSSIASVGLLGMFTSARMQPVNVLGRSVGGGGRRLGQDRTERFIMTGLASTLVMGGMSIGGAYASRYLTRRYFASKRQLGNGDTDNIDENRNS